MHAKETKIRGWGVTMAAMAITPPGTMQSRYDVEG